MAITLILSLEECEALGLVDEIILILGDNTSAISWIIRSRLPSKSIYYSCVHFIARTIAAKVSASKNFVSQQHLAGLRNLICDWLSFEGSDRTDHKGTAKQNPVAFDKPPNDVVSHRIVSSFSQLVPQGFKISHLPPEIFSFAQAAVRILEQSLMQKQKEEESESRGTGEGLSPSVAINSSSLPALLEYPETNSMCTYGPSLSCTEDPDFLSQESLLQDIRSRARENLLGKQSARWVRRSGTISGSVCFTNRECLTSEYCQN